MHNLSTHVYWGPLQSFVTFVCVLECDTRISSSMVFLLALYISSCGLICLVQGKGIHLYPLHIDTSSKINRSVHHHAHYDMASTYIGKSGSHKTHMKFPWNSWEFFAWKRNVQTSCDFDIVCMWISYNWNFARYLCEIVYLMFHCCVM